MAAPAADGQAAAAPEAGRGLIDRVLTQLALSDVPVHLTLQQHSLDLYYSTCVS